MKINVASLQSRIQNKMKEFGIEANTLYTFYYFECLLKRISLSKYADNFIIKGGFLLSSVVGIIHRTTRDIDFLLDNTDFNQNTIIKMMNEIINIRTEDSVQFEINSIDSMRENDEYGGYRVNLKVEHENMQTNINLDIATGDPITPSKVKYIYKTLITNEEFVLNSYNIETILAEKMQTILDKNIFNSRSKDFYDIYILMKLKANDISATTLKAAFIETCEHRNAVYSKVKIINIISALGDDSILNRRWTEYTKKNLYATDIPFNDIMITLNEIVKMIV